MKIPQNRTVSKLFRQCADVLELKGENPFRVNAYRNASHLLDNLAQDVKDIEENQFIDLQDLPAIGKDLEEDIKEIVCQGSFFKLDKLKKSLPAYMQVLVEIDEMSMAHLKCLQNHPRINNVHDLKQVGKKNELQALPGFSEGLEDKILNVLNQRK